MKSFLELTNSNNEILLLEPDSIYAIETSKVKPLTDIYIKERTEPFVVKEKVQIIINKLREVKLAELIQV